MEVDDPLKILEEQLEQESKKQDKRSRFKLLHDITIRFENDRRYRNDTRYIRIWLQYASYFRHAEWIYDYMFEQGIGEYVGAFYEQAAEYYTLYRNSQSGAEEIIKLGIQKKAEPLSRLYQILHSIQQQQQQVNRTDDIPLLPLNEYHKEVTAVSLSQQVKKNHHDFIISSNPTIEIILKQHQMRMATVQACYQNQEILSFEELRIQRQPELLIFIIEEEKHSSNATTLLHGGVERQTTSFFHSPVHGIGSHSEEEKKKKTSLNRTPSNDRTDQQQQQIHVVYTIPPSTTFIRRHTFTHLASKNGFHDFSSLCSKRIQIGQMIQLSPNGISFRIIKKVGQGGVARVYHAATNNKNYAIKVEKPANSWEFYILNKLQHRLSINNNNNEKKMIPPSQYIIHVYDLYLFKDTSFLIMEYSNQGTLLDCFNHYRNQQCRATMTESLALFLTMRLLQAVQTIHDVGIIHGDLKMDNIIFSFPNNKKKEEDNRMDEDTIMQWQNKPYLILIDFGRAMDLTLLPSNVKLKADWPPQTTDPYFVRQGIEFLPYSIDYYGIAHMIHWLLFGKVMRITRINNERQKIQERWKRYWHIELWAQLFDVLLNPPVNNTSAFMTTMIYKIDQILQQDKHLETCLSQLKNPLNL
ncbi:kinase-like domain-containing protein [Circinella umbellata]|nr:kinase-like domain-containing protein [Circinella umbellata]